MQAVQQVAALLGRLAQEEVLPVAVPVAAVALLVVSQPEAVC